MLRIIDVFPNWLNGFIFSKLHEQGKALPWDEDNNIDNTLVDYDYIAHSGDKIIAPIVEKLLTDNTPDNQTKLFNLIYQKYIKNWTALYATLTTDYNPIENYSMVETEQENNKITNDLTDTLEKNETNNTTITDNTTNTTNATNTTNTSDNATNTNNKTITEQQQGFNSNDWNDVKKTSENTTDETTNTGNKTTTDETTDTLEKNETNNSTITDNTTQKHTGTTDNNNSRTLTRSGNIGVTTTQQMLQSERELRQYDYFKNIFEDIDKILTLVIY